MEGRAAVYRHVKAVEAEFTSTEYEMDSHGQDHNQRQYR